MESDNKQQVEDKRLFYLDKLSYGHGIYSAEMAKQATDAFGLPFDEKLVRLHKGTLTGDIKGVWDLDLIAYISDQLQIPREDVGYFMGRGFQAQAYAEAIKEKLGLKNAIQ